MYTEVGWLGNKNDRSRKLLALPFTVNAPKLVSRTFRKAVGSIPFRDTERVGAIWVGVCPLAAQPSSLCGGQGKERRATNLLSSSMSSSVPPPPPPYLLPFGSYSVRTRNYSAIWNVSQRKYGFWPCHLLMNAKTSWINCAYENFFHSVCATVCIEQTHRIPLRIFVYLYPREHDWDQINACARWNEKYKHSYVFSYSALLFRCTCEILWWHIIWRGWALCSKLGRTSGAFSGYGISETEKVDGSHGNFDGFDGYVSIIALH